eukprot:1915364-Pleurochrysis_carterae.AAC.1
MHEDGGIKISASAYYVKAKADHYLPKPLADYPLYETPATPQLMKDYEIAASKKHTIDAKLKSNTRPKFGVPIYAPPCGRLGESFAIEILARRALTFPTKEMDKLANRVMAYMAHTADNCIEFKTNGD